MRILFFNFWLFFDYYRFFCILTKVVFLSSLWHIANNL